MSAKTAISFFLLLIPFFSLAQKNDTVILLNSNIITGEIKNLQQGQMLFKTDGMGTVNIKAEEIKSMKSSKRFQIQLYNGYVYFGNFDTINGPGTFVKIVTSAGTAYKINVKDIVEIFPFRKRLWDRVSGTFSTGTSYGKSSKILQLNFSGNLTFWGKKRYSSAAWTDNISAYEDSIITNKQSYNFTYRHYIKNGFSAQSTFEYAKNKELGLNRRYSLNILAGKDIIHKYRALLYFGTGLSGNSERFEGDLESKVNFEWDFETRFDIYKRSSPEISLSTYANFYPSFTVKGRYRASATIETRVEVFNNFYVGIQFYDDFDNKPQSNNTETNTHTNDWGVNGTISFSFH